mgnify:CR=1 FL=1
MSLNPEKGNADAVSATGWAGPAGGSDGAAESGILFDRRESP